MHNFKYKALLVEDLRIAQKVAVLRLNEQGVEVDIAESGAQALELVGKKPYDLIFMDLGLDDISGLAVMEIIRKTAGKNRCTPIIVLTAHDSPETRENCSRAGVDDFFVKPLTAENIQFILKKYF